MIMPLLALAMQIAVPAEWSAKVDPVALAPDDAQESQHRDALVRAWDLVRGHYRDILLDAVRTNTKGNDTDWAAAREQYIARYAAALKASDAALLHNRMQNVRGRPTTVTTECTTYSGRYASTTRCRSTAD